MDRAACGRRNPNRQPPSAQGRRVPRGPRPREYSFLCRESCTAWQSESQPTASSRGGARTCGQLPPLVLAVVLRIGSPLPGSSSPDFLIGGRHAARQCCLRIPPRRSQHLTAPVFSFTRQVACTRGHPPPNPRPPVALYQAPRGSSRSPFAPAPVLRHGFLTRNRP